MRRGAIVVQSARNLFCDYREQMFEKHDGNTMDILFLIQSVNREKMNMISLFLAHIFEFFVSTKAAPRRTILSWRRGAIFWNRQLKFHLALESVLCNKWSIFFSSYTPSSKLYPTRKVRHASTYSTSYEFLCQFSSAIFKRVVAYSANIDNFVKNSIK